MIAGEFFSRATGTFGGFGFLARRLATLLPAASDGRIEVIFLGGTLRHPSGRVVVDADGVRTLFASGQRWRDTARTLAERIDLLVTIDWDPHYVRTLRTLPRTPCVVWIKDPRPDAALELINTLEVPGVDGCNPTGEGGSRWRSLRLVLDESARLRRRIVFAHPSQDLLERVAAAFEPVDESMFLGYPLDPALATGPKRDSPLVTLLGRLDAVKRPWVVPAVARRLPDVGFVLAGAAHPEAPSGWMDELPSNVRLAGHLGEDEKRRLLAESWLLINTSIWEGLPVSLVEGLHHENAVVSLPDTGAVASRFGEHVPNVGGSGLEASERLAAAVRRLVDMADTRAARAEAGRVWAMETHTNAAFAMAFNAVCSAAEVALPPLEVTDRAQ